MMGITTLLVLTFTACTSAVPAAMVEQTVARNELALRAAREEVAPQVPIVSAARNFSIAAREELVGTIAQAVSKPSTDCTCGKSMGLFCGVRTSKKDKDAPVTGNCNATSLYYCSAWAVNTTGLADVIQSPCWANKCYQSTHVGYDSCTASRESSAAKENLASEHLRHSPPAKKSTTKTDEELLAKSSTAQASAADLFIDAAATAKSKFVSVKDNVAVTAGGLKFMAVSHDQPVAREKLVPKVAASPLPVCTCGSQSGYYCGERATAPAQKNEQRLLMGNCTSGAVYKCENWSLTSTQPAKLCGNSCASGKCYQSGETGWDSCHH